MNVLCKMNFRKIYETINALLEGAPDSLSIFIAPSVSGVEARPGYELWVTPTAEPGVAG